MAANFGYVKLPAYQVPEGWDTTPLSNALTQWRKAREKDVELDQGQQRLDLAKGADARSAETHADTRQDRFVKQIGMEAQRIEDMDDADPRKAVARQRLINSNPMIRPLLQKYGQDPDGPDVAKFILAQSGLYKSKDTVAKESLDRRLKGAQAENYEADAALRRSKAGVAQTEADSKAVARDARTSLRRYELMLSAKSPEEWAKIQPELSRGFGRQVPFAEREKFIQMHEDELDKDMYGPDEEGNLQVTPSPIKQRRGKPMPTPSKLGGPVDEAQETPAIGEWQTTTMPTPPMKVGAPPPLDQAVEGAGAFARPVAFRPSGTMPAAPEGTDVIQPAQSQQKIDRQERTIRELGPIVNPKSQQQQADPSKPRQPTEAEIQQYWMSVYGQKPPSGQKYTRDGSLLNMKAMDDKTRGAILGALDYSKDAIKDVKEALEQSALSENFYNPNWMYQNVLDTGTFARANKALNIAIRGVLHGISGAQINIPEQQEYFNSFRPAWDDSLSTARYKLNHLGLVLSNIEKATKKGGSVDEASLLELRNEMRRGLKLGPVDLDGRLVKTGTQGRAPAQRQSPPQTDAGPGDRNKDRLKNKYGLE